MKRVFLGILIFLFFNSFAIAEGLEVVELNKTKESFLAIIDEKENIQPKLDSFDGIVNIQMEPDELIEGALEENIVNENELVKKEPDFKLSVENPHRIIPTGKTLLEDRLYYRFDEGFVEDMFVYGAYHGGFSFNFIDNQSYNTKYHSYIGEAGVVGKFRNLPMEYRFSLNFVPEEGIDYLKTLPLDNFITINLKHNTKIRIGHTRTANGYEGGMSGYVKPFVMKSQLSRTLSNARALGIKSIGKHKYVEYDVGVFSSDRYFCDFFPGVEFVGNVNFKPLANTNGKYGKLLIGTSFNVGSRDNNYKNFGLNATYSYKKFKWDFEYMTADGYNGRDLMSSTARAEGFYTTLYYKLTEKIELLARYDQFCPDKDVSHRLDKEYVAGINYRIKGDALKIMINYIYYDNFDNRSGSRFLIGTQFIL